MKVRGTLSIGIIGIFFVSGDIFQRLVLTPLVRVFPSTREKILSWWARFVSNFILKTVGIVGGARFEPAPPIPGERGVLVIGNHQSLLDIPLACASMKPLYPRVVSRERYARGKPLISYLIRMYQYPTVNPRATVKTDLEALRKTSAESDVPMMIYPEGTRTKDGNIVRLRRNGLRAMLSGRDWRVYVLSVDGYWQCAKLKDFLTSVSTIRGTSDLSGPYHFDGPSSTEEELEAFIDELEAAMHSGVARLRGEVSA